METQDNSKTANLSKGTKRKKQPAKSTMVPSSNKKFCSPRIFLFSREQKIVSAVWYHERKYSGLSKQDILNNFAIRFKTTPPQMETISKWEKKLFSKGLTCHRGRLTSTLWRLIHAPYVRESLKRNPDISNRSRAALLGISQGTLKLIMEQDLKDYPPGFDDEQVDITESNEIKEEDQG